MTNTQLLSVDFPNSNQEIRVALETILSKIESRSKRTLEGYLSDTNEFCIATRGVKLEELSNDDLAFTLFEVERYQLNLLEKGLAASTINKKLAGVKKIFKRLADYGFPVNERAFNIERLVVAQVNHYDAMSYEEILQAIILVRETRKGDIKAALIKLAYSTAFRLNSILNLKWDDTEKYDDETYIIKTIGKGNKLDQKKIPVSLYHEMKKLPKTLDGRIFDISKKSIDKMMAFLRENMNFGKRAIVFHSFKKTSIQAVAHITDYDLKAMQKQGNHSNIQTTLNSYIAEKELEEMVVLDIDKPSIDLSKLKELSKDELILLIMTLDDSSKHKIAQQLKHI